MISSTSHPAAITREVRHIISQRKHIQLRRLQPSTSLAGELGLDTVDVVDIILALERRFHLTIPDEVPLQTVGDLVGYVSSYRPASA
ncbi:acyl carrier protein [uncultured Hymenobacter sp.]|uniref:acyl carrier protein n=1 Tax=uncultured Hymenobacter sp. TaxID=170016 RepID=UPI0035CB7BA9